MTSRIPIFAAATLALVIGATAVTRTAPVPAQQKLLAYEAQAKALLAQMTLDEKIGQMTQAGPGDPGGS